MRKPLRILVVEDEALLLMQLEIILEEEGHIIVGTALSSREAIAIAPEVGADLALIDIHLADGPTGIEVSRFITERTGTMAVFMTANPARIPDDFSGALGVIAKPYTQMGLRLALNYIEAAIRTPPPTKLPRSLVLAPPYVKRWSALGHSA